ncbi:LysR substrate-binding domain-containing protein [Streptomyces sp. S.PNR 29]|uniref:LysR substrate-binding domain-containing protein n=1 Tax=Streptomyces sp. S.PNR 29 TaxID=2973805 RepID=UPI0025B1FE6A|nr:LysR substrate-binding domain-containing protein [Streptomyces sp. S.PNR 29]MDN0196529.1 LysR substrate-binding domain-containing protein [Streptomyces sp. S.PNR 29]
MFGEQLTARAALTVPDPHAVVVVVTAGTGYSVLPRSLCEEHLAVGRLVLLGTRLRSRRLNTLYLVQRPAPTPTRT